MEINGWLAAAIADAERRGLPELRPLVEALAQATRALRASELPRQERTYGTIAPGSAADTGDSRTP
jgi:hypothetical protein